MGGSNKHQVFIKKAILKILLDFFEKCLDSHPKALVPEWNQVAG